MTPAQVRSRLLYLAHQINPRSAVEIRENDGRKTCKLTIPGGPWYEIECREPWADIYLEMVGYLDKTDWAEWAPQPTGGRRWEHGTCG